MTLPNTPRAAALALVAALTAAPLAAQTQTDDQNPAEASGAPSADVAEDQLFTPMVQACVAAPGVEECGPVRAVVTECAADLNEERCEVLFVRPEAVFADPAAAQEAQDMLAEAAEAIAGMAFAQDDGVVEAARADAERTMLRGDENLSIHSAPPLIAE
jgi:hypothetical protein